MSDFQHNYDIIMIYCKYTINDKDIIEDMQDNYNTVLEYFNGGAV